MLVTIVRSVGMLVDSIPDVDCVFVKLINVKYTLVVSISGSEVDFSFE